MLVISSKYLDPQTFSRPGFPEWSLKFDEVNTRRDRIRATAEKKAADMGHVLFPWTCMNSCMCRKCGRTLYLHNIHGSTDVGDMEGRALYQRCDVGFDGPDKFGEYEVQDYHGTTII